MLLTLGTVASVNHGSVPTASGSLVRVRKQQISGRSLPVEVRSKSSVKTPISVLTSAVAAVLTNPKKLVPLPKPPDSPPEVDKPPEPPDPVAVLDLTKSKPNPPTNYTGDALLSTIMSIDVHEWFCEKYLNPITQTVSLWIGETLSGDCGCGVTWKTVISSKCYKKPKRLMLWCWDCLIKKFGFEGFKTKSLIFENQQYLLTDDLKPLDSRRCLAAPGLPWRWLKGLPFSSASNWKLHPRVRFHSSSLLIDVDDEWLKGIRAQILGCLLAVLVFLSRSRRFNILVKIASNAKCETEELYASMECKAKNIVSTVTPPSVREAR